jgi:hypothetical protein
MTRVFWMMLSTLYILASCAVARTDNAPVRTTPFPDVPKTHWAYDAVESLRQKGILRGYPPEVRKPAPAVKRPSRPSPQNHAKRRSA